MFFFSRGILQQFNKLNQIFTAIELENRDDCAEIQAALGEITGATSVILKWNSFFDLIKLIITNYNIFLILFKVPRVFINGNFVGGGSDVKKMNETGELKKLLE